MTRLALTVTLLASFLTACGPTQRSTEIYVVAEAGDRDVRQWDDNKLIRIYFLVHPERIRVAKALADWDPALRHDRNKPWYKNYLAQLTSSERTLKRELRRRRLAN